MAKYISEYILESEFRCPCCNSLPPGFYVEGMELFEVALPFLMLFKGFRDVREELGEPLPINSGYRCLKRNKKVRGTDLSIHLFGLAFDVKRKAGVLAAVRKRIPNFRIGIYKTWIHMDVGYYIHPKARDEWHKGARWGK